MIDRRGFIAGLSAATASTAALSHAQTKHVRVVDRASDLPVRFSLNTSTLRGNKLSVPEQVRITAEAGYDGIEPWIGDLRSYVDAGGKLADLKRQIVDAGLQVVSAIGFAQWIVDDDSLRAAGLEEARRDMELVRSLGGTHIAAPPIGAHRPGMDKPSLDQIADRYRALCDVGDQVGVSPQLELWGFSPTLHTLAELAYIATAVSHPRACVLPDFYHIYKGGNDFVGLSMIEASRFHCFHINDYPGDPPREEIADRDRVFPGDGVCDLAAIIGRLIRDGFSGSFSLELFNPEYWKRDPMEVAQEGLAKSKAVVADAIG